MNYLKAVLKKDETTKINELKNLIILGKKLNKNTTPDEKKLEILLQRQNKSVIKKVKKTNTSKNQSTYKHSVKRVYTSSNKIIVEFNIDITKDDLKFFELKRGNTYKDVFDMQGYFKDAKPTKLKIAGVDKIAIGQFKPNTLRIVLAHNKNLPTKTKIERRKITIFVNGIKTKATRKKPSNAIKIKPVIKKIENKEINSLIDRKNSIRSIYTDENKIVIKFNKDFSKKMLKYSAFKLNGSYNDVFNIQGKYAHTKPTKLKIDGLDRIIVREKGSNTLQIRIMNKKDIRVYYYVKKRELTIKVVGLDKTNSSKKKSTPAPFKFRNKVIVIDPGHGGKDPGAIGPNRRYEKVVALKVSKYLYSILKQRGYKVYLTRSTDRFIEVGKRTDLARKKNADVFISVHANAVVKSKASKAQGIETFYLSPAKSERAKRVAARENRADSRKMNKATIDAAFGAQNYLVMKNSHALSVAVQSKMLESARTQYKDVKDKGAKTGPFWVLLDTPKASILVELGFISHPVESKRLYNSSYQKKLAIGMANGIEFYFQHPLD